jgi:peptidoglycan/LPS O-acetylase OafA/YrhL
MEGLPAMPSRLLDLQSLRGLACLVVLFSHAAEWEPRTGVQPELCLLHPLPFFGCASADIFLVLSGFIITWSHAESLGRPGALLPYALRRFCRVFPTYWVCWLGAALPRILRSGELPALSDAVTCLLLLPQQGSEPFPQGSLQAANVAFPQNWTMVYDLMFYLLFACFFLLPRRWFVPGLLVWAAGTVALGFTRWPDLGFYAGLPLQPLFLEFVFGCLAATLIRRQKIIRPRLCIAAGVLWIAVAGWLHYAGLTTGPFDARLRILSFGIPAVLLVYGLAAHERTRAPMLPRWLLPLGDASYSIYLVHVVVFAGVFKLTGGMSQHLLPHLGWIALMMASALLAGFLVHVCVDRPLLRWLRPGPSRPGRRERACGEVVSPVDPAPV